MPLNILHGGQPLPHRTIQPRMSVVARLRNPGFKKKLIQVIRHYRQKEKGAEGMFSRVSVFWRRQKDGSSKVST